MRPKIRSRLVAREVRELCQENCFTLTPPFESFRMIVSCAVTQLDVEEIKIREPQTEQRVQLLFVDIPRADFNDETDPSRPTYVDLPPEAGAPAGTCSLLRRICKVRSALRRVGKTSACPLICLCASGKDRHRLG